GARVLSGCSTNGCLALSRLGHRTALVGRVGHDYYQRFMDEAQLYDIAADVRVCEQTGGFSLIYDDRGDRTLDVLGVAAPIDHVPAACADAHAIIVGPILQETPLQLIEQIRAESPAPLFLDPQGLLRRIDASGRVEHFWPSDLVQIAPHCRVI